MKKFKIILLPVILSVALSSCTCTEEKCREKYGLIRPDECPPSRPELPCSGVPIENIDKAVATGYIDAAKAGAPLGVIGVEIDPCQALLIAQVSQKLYINIGKKPDGMLIYIGKYILASGDSAYAVVGYETPNAPPCPPSTKCY